MGKYLSIIVGAVIVLAGIGLVVAWWCDIIAILKGSVPLALILGGALAVAAGLSELADEAAAGKNKK